jgi:hypothetical protein
MKEYVVTYRLTPEQEAAVQEIFDALNKTALSLHIRNGSVEERFDFMMTLGSTHDINSKIEFWRVMIENGKRDIFPPKPQE